MRPKGGGRARVVLGLNLCLTYHSHSSIYEGSAANGSAAVPACLTKSIDRECGKARLIWTAGQDVAFLKAHQA